MWIMSGGHFEYRQYRLEDFAGEIDQLIARNSDETMNEWGEKRGMGFTDATIIRFKEAAHTLRRAQDMMQRVDWLMSEDDGEETFHERWDSDEVRGEFAT